jgi:hypothetical protein
MGFGFMGLMIFTAYVKEVEWVRMNSHVHSVLLNVMLKVCYVMTVLTKIKGKINL